ncbi:MAG TPA: hypothetical protein VND95_03345 [Stellaceae bacterium]|nr:hypothetical protein [Stellaceae bacterium]
MNDAEWRLVDRFKEPSSWAALAAALGTLGIAVPGQFVQVISLFGAGLCSALGILLREK